MSRAANRHRDQRFPSSRTFCPAAAESAQLLRLARRDGVPCRIEPLEPRLLLSGTQYLVNSLADIVDSDGVVTLREAMQAANDNSAVTDDVEPGSTDATDLITFDQAALEAEAGAGNPLVITLNGSQLEITGDLEIVGLGDDVLTIDANGGSRVLYVYGTDTEAILSGLTLTGGNADQSDYVVADGGGVFNYFGTLFLTGTTVSGNRTDWGGGGIGNSLGTLTLTNTTVSGNTASSSGGGISNSGTMMLTDTMVSGNTSSGYRGGGINNSGTMALIDTTVSENSIAATHNTSGGGINNFGTMTLMDTTVSGNTVGGTHDSIGGGICNYGPLTLTNTMVNGNTAGWFGGGIYTSSSDTVMLTNTTISGNAAGYGGGIYNSSGTLTLGNSIVALNTAGTTGDDISGPYTGSHSLIGGDPGFVRNPDPGGDGVWGTGDDDYGDLRLTTGSPAIDEGDNELLPEDTYDLDGDGITTEPLPIDLAGVFRVYDGDDDGTDSVDMGAYEYGVSFVVDTRQDWDGVSIDGLISLREAMVAANTNAAAGDAPAGNPVEVDVIMFDQAALEAEAGAGNPLVISLNGSQLETTEDVKITGLGADVLTIDANGASRLLYVNGSDTEAGLSGLTLTGGSAGDRGGGIHNRGRLTLTNTKVIASMASGSPSYGGGIYNDEGIVTLTNTMFNGNTAHNGGGIYNYGGTVTLTNTRVSGNAAGHAGGGICNVHFGTVTFTNTTVSGNTTADWGGGICNYGTATLTNTTVSGNTAAAGHGGGIYNLATQTLDNSIVALNTAGTTGDDISGPYTGSHSLIGGDPGFVRDPDPGDDGLWGTGDDDYGDLRLTEGSPAIDAGDDATLPADAYDLDADGDTAEPLPIDLAGVVRVHDGDGDGAATVDIGAYESGVLFVVDTLEDWDGVSTDGLISLREAMVAANTNAAAGDAAAGSGVYAEVIDFDQAALEAEAGAGNPLVITLNGSQLEITEDLKITGLGAGVLAIDANGASRLLYVSGSDTEAGLSGLTLTGGSPGGPGGGIFNSSGTVTLTNTTVTGNTGETDGGGIYNFEGVLTLTNTMVSGNMARYGGGIRSFSGTLTLTNTTVSGNMARYGGAIYEFAGTMTLTNTTISGNTAERDGGGIYNPSAVTLHNTIVALNTAGTTGDDISGPYTGSHSLIGGDPGFVRNPDPGGDGVWGTGDDDYGDLRLTEGSPAIDAGDDALLPADAYDLDGDEDVAEPLPIDPAGNPRIGGAAVDIGAHEFHTDPPFLDIQADLSGVNGCCLAWGDYDSDGDLDLALAGDTGGVRVTKVYANDSGIFTDVLADLPGVNDGSLAWGDYDGDGDLDLAVAGDTGGVRVTKVYANDSGIFTDVLADLPGVGDGCLSWGDYDNDGDLDLALAGHTGSQRIARIYGNDGTGGFAAVGAGLTGVDLCALSWGDCDSDGDLDLALAGYTGGQRTTRIYGNDGAGGFAPIGAGLVGVCYCSLSWGDYDNDGDLDLAVAGDTGTEDICCIYDNDGEGGFTAIGAGLVGTCYCSLAWGDYDNDGDLDLAMAGYTGSERVTRIYGNDGAGGFATIGANLEAVSSCCLAWGDYDSDGDLDLALAGWTGAQRIARICGNDASFANTHPTAPTGLSASVDASTVTLNWSAATDAETLPAGLSYNVRVGTSPGADDVFCSMAATDGWRRLPTLGNAQQRLSWTIGDLPYGEYYWSVQAIDASYAGSAWAAEQGPVTLVLPGDANGDGTVSDADYTIWADHYGQCGVGAAEGDFNGDGCVTDADYTIWADHYGAASGGPAGSEALSSAEETAPSDGEYTAWVNHYGTAETLESPGDFNGDGVVTDADYTIWADHYGKGRNAAEETVAQSATSAATVRDHPLRHYTVGWFDRDWEEVDLLAILSAPEIL